jgi:hypothetical protein
LDQRRILCADEESAKIEAARQQEQESDPGVVWRDVVRGGQWYAMPTIDRPEPFWQALLSPEWFFG